RRHLLTGFWTDGFLRQRFFSRRFPLIFYVVPGTADSSQQYRLNVLYNFFAIYCDNMAVSALRIYLPPSDVNSEADECNGNGFAVSGDEQQNLSSSTDLPERLPFSDAHNIVILAVADHELWPAPLQGDQVDAYTSGASQQPISELFKDFAAPHLHVVHREDAVDLLETEPSIFDYTANQETQEADARVVKGGICEAAGGAEPRGRYPPVSFEGRGTATSYIFRSSCHLKVRCMVLCRFATSEETNGVFMLGFITTHNTVWRFDRAGQGIELAFTFLYRGDAKSSPNRSCPNIREANRFGECDEFREVNWKQFVVTARKMKCERNETACMFNTSVFSIGAVELGAGKPSICGSVGVVPFATD
ncbi:unnamed protein product, partial [Toxocara canis]|uniref:Peptidase A1 domain-containing protein n=1 Tax=Toxocara canis TaxID=6265 RepID=A0A183VD38_TOXCA